MSILNVNVSDAVKKYYMPHRAVIKEEETTTKIRVIFDASAHSPEDLSLNEYLHSG